MNMMGQSVAYRIADLRNYVALQLYCASKMIIEQHTHIHIHTERATHKQQLQITHQWRLCLKSMEVHHIKGNRRIIGSVLSALSFCLCYFCCCFSWNMWLLIFCVAFIVICVSSMCSFVRISCSLYYFQHFFCACHLPAENQMNMSETKKKLQTMNFGLYEYT